MTSVVAYWVGYDGPRKPVTPLLPPATKAGPPIRSLNRRPSPPAPRTRSRERYSEVYAPPKAGADAS